MDKETMNNEGPEIHNLVYDYKLNQTTFDNDFLHLKITMFE